MKYYLTKSDFKVARSCPTKLYYKKRGYPSNKDDDEYLQLLSDSGYIIEKIARTLFPGGCDMRTTPDIEQAYRESLSALQHEQVTLFEPTLIASGRLARIDILVKQGLHFDLYEVKAKAFDSRENQARLQAGKPNLFHTQGGHFAPAWREYLEDIAFQTAVLQACFPQATIRPYLIMPDTSRPTPIDNLNERFQLERTRFKGDFQDLQITYTGDVEQLRQDHFLVLQPVSDEVDRLLPDVIEASKELLASLQPELIRLPANLSLKCRHCEYNCGGRVDVDGFQECWGELAAIRPSIFGLYRLDAAGGRRSKLANRLITKGQVGLFDIPREAIACQDGLIARRQLIQLDCTRQNKEWMSEELATMMDGLSYPLQFIDFETTDPAVPYHAGMHPYETIAYQWSCHIVREPGADPEHYEWLNTENHFPNFAFAEALQQTISLDGSIFIWATHERTILKTILAQMRRRGHRRPVLHRWLQDVIRRPAKGWSPLIDMNELTLKHYFHPLMKGRTSIKVVTDAVWKSNRIIRARFPEYVKLVDGVPLNPYDVLPSETFEGIENVIREGTGAVRAYEALLSAAKHGNHGQLEGWSQLLRQYCRLDTAAMVMIWWHWGHLATGQRLIAA